MISSCRMSITAHRWVARAVRPGGPEVIELGVEDLVPLKSGEALVRVEAAGLNHAETLIRSGKYAVRLPFPTPSVARARAPSWPPRRT